MSRRGDVVADDGVWSLAAQPGLEGRGRLEQVLESVGRQPPAGGDAGRSALLEVVIALVRLPAPADFLVPPVHPAPPYLLTCLGPGPTTLRAVCLVTQQQTILQQLCLGIARQQR